MRRPLLGSRVIGTVPRIAVGLAGVAAFVTGSAAPPVAASPTRPLPAGLMRPANPGLSNHTGTGRLELPSPRPSAIGGATRAFVRNEGQADPSVRYLATWGGSTLHLTDRGPVLVAVAPPSRPSTSTERGSGSLRTSPPAFNNTRTVNGVALALRFVNGAARPSMTASDVEPGIVNYLMGHDRSSWHPGLRRYRTITYHEVWPGIDAVFRAGPSMKYEFIVHPGGNVASIHLAWEGAERVERLADGSLRVDTVVGHFDDAAPVSYQVAGGAARLAVRSRFVLTEGGDVRFAVGPFDSSRDLVIDPQLEYSSYLGGSADDAAGDVAVDASGATYVTGTTESIDFPASPGAFQTTFGGVVDAFVAKISPDGSALDYATYLGGTAEDFGTGIAVDDAGNAYVGGWTRSTDFPTTPECFQSDGGGTFPDGFVTELDPSGASPVYSTYLGGTRDDELQGLALDTNGDTYVTGYSGSSDYPTTPGAYDTTYNSGTSDVVVTELDPVGSSLVYSSYLGGTGLDTGEGLATDGEGKVYVAGVTQSGDFPTTSRAFDRQYSGTADGFVTAMNLTSSSLVYSTFMAGKDDSTTQLWDVAVDASGAAYVTGATSSASYPTTPGAFDHTFNGPVSPPGWNGADMDLVVTKVRPTGRSLAYSTFVGDSIETSDGYEVDYGYGIQVDGAGQAWVVGATTSLALPTSKGGFQRTLSGIGADALVLELNAKGSTLLYGSYLGGPDPIPNTFGYGDVATGVALGSDGAVHVTGYTSSTGFPVTAGAFQPTLAGGMDTFVTRLDPAGGTRMSAPNAASPNWVQRLPTTPVPATRAQASMAYDQASDQTVLFGGFDWGGLGDTWDWDGHRWSELHPSSAPAQRAGPVLAYDAAAQEVVLFGGYDPFNGNLFSDTWTWDGTTWTEQHPAASPPVQYGSAFTDPLDGHVDVFGGACVSHLKSCTKGTIAPYSRATWQWDGTTWHRLRTATAPSGRAFAPVGDDSTNGGAVLFGGLRDDGSNFVDLGDTWTFDGTTWTKQSPASAPLPRMDASLADDPAFGGAALFGGCAYTQQGCSPDGNGFNDTWTWNGSDWKELATKTSPYPLYESAVAFDARTGQVVLAGGSLSTFGDPIFATWTLNPGP